MDLAFKSVCALVACLILSLSAAARAESLATKARDGRLPKGVVVLVPGTLNSATPGNYFGPISIDTFRARGFEVFVIPGLNPTGQFEENGQIVLKTLKSWYFAKFPAGGVPIHFIGHSAGGFYALHAVNVDKTLPVKNMIFFSTPLQGSRLADFWFPSQTRDPFYWFNTLANVGSLGFFDLKGLPQMTTANVRKFLSQIRLPSQIKLFALGGSQENAPDFLSRFDARYLGPEFVASARIINQQCDGIVESVSAYGRNARILRVDGTQAEITPLPQLHAPLDHPEQAFDSRYLKLVGLKNLGIVDQEQLRVYSGLADVIETSD